MKRTVFFAIAITITTFVANAQKINAGKLPAVVKENFVKSYPNATAIHWNKENADFEASFKNEGKKLSVVFDTKGAVKEVETELKLKDLPAAVQTVLKGMKVKEVAKIKKGDITYYEAEVKGKDLYFDAAGKAVKL